MMYGGRTYKLFTKIKDPQRRQLPRGADTFPLCISFCSYDKPDIILLIFRFDFRIFIWFYVNFIYFYIYKRLMRQIPTEM